MPTCSHWQAHGRRPGAIRPMETYALLRSRRCKLLREAHDNCLVSCRGKFASFYCWAVFCGTLGLGRATICACAELLLLFERLQDVKDPHSCVRKHRPLWMHFRTPLLVPDICC